MSYIFMMDTTYHDLADRALELLHKSHRYRIIILVIGAPGSGKTTVAQRVVDLLNQRHEDQGKKVTGWLNNEEVLAKLINDDLPEYSKDEEIDYEDEGFTPRIERLDAGEIVIRGRGGDDTSIKISQRDIHEKDDDKDQFAQVIPMDGFHLPRSILNKFKDSENAIKRRGSPFTFDSSLVVKLVENINATLQLEVSDDINELDIVENSPIPDIYIPSFDHHEKDPRRYGIKIGSSSRILIMEGLYLLLNNPIWCEISKTLEPTIEMEVNDNLNHDIDAMIHNNSNANIKDIPIPSNKTHEFWKILISDSKMLERVGKRHLKAGIVNSLEEGEERVKVNDLPNGQKVYSESFKCDLNIISIDDVNEL